MTYKSTFTYPLIICLFLLALSLSVCTSCTSDPQPPEVLLPPPDSISLSYVNYYVENSGGMFGFVSGGFNNYISAVSELAQKAEFITSGV